MIYLEGPKEELLRVTRRIARGNHGARISFGFRDAPGAVIIAPHLSLNRLLGLVHDACLSEGLAPRISLAPKNQILPGPKGEVPPAWKNEIPPAPKAESPAGFRPGKLVILRPGMECGGDSRGRRAPGQRASEKSYSGTSVGISD